MSGTQGNERPYFRTPRISPDGRQVAFVYAGDIWLVDVQGGTALHLNSNPANHSWPCWSPDGSQLAFTSSRAGATDIYLLPLGEGGAGLHRITFHEAPSIVEAWSPDGRHLFFSSAREQMDEAIYRVGAAGGTPIAWVSQPHESVGHVAVSPAGATLAFNLWRDPWWRRGPNPYGGAEIWLASNAPGASDFRRLSDQPGLNRWPMWAPDGQGLYFVSDRDGIENLWYQPLAGGQAQQITRFREGRMLWPSISGDGARIVFERDFAIWRLELASGAAAPIEIRAGRDTPLMPPQVVTYRDNLTELEPSPDGKKVAFVVRGEIFADFADKEIDKEQRAGTAFRVTNNAFRDDDVCWAPDSRRLAYVSDRYGDEDLFLYDFVSRAERRLTDSRQIAGPKHNPRFSPDGVWLAYGCGEDEIRLLNQSTGEDRLLVRAPFMYRSQLAWAPDSRWLAFVAEDQHWFRNLYVQRVDEQQPRQITFLSTRSAYGPIWSPDGRLIVFSCDGMVARVDLRPPTPFFRESEFDRLFEQKEQRGEGKELRPEPPAAPAPEQPPNGDGAPPAMPRPPTQSRPMTEESDGAPAAEARAGTGERPRAADAAVMIVFEGIERRLRFVTPLRMQAQALCISPDSRDLIFSAWVAGKQSLWAAALDEPRQDQAPRQITANGGRKGSAHFAPDGKSFYFLDNGQIAIRKFPQGDQTTLPVLADVTLDFEQEKRQMFAECWRRLRDYFYDPTFRGLDWQAAREQFAPLAAGAQTHGDLLAVLNLMVGELRASHMGAYPGGGGGGSQGYLGLLFDVAEQAASGRLRIREVIADGPAALPSGGSIAVGDTLLAVNGVELHAGLSLDSLLLRTAGRRVLLRLAPQAGGEPYEVAVRPCAAGAYRTLRYRAWVLANEGYVHRVSGGRLGYVHIRAMNDESYRQFLVDLDSEAYSKEGVIVDVRFNGGGSTGTFIIDILARRGVLVSSFRDRPPIDAGYYHGNRTLNRPTIVLINESSASNTEMFAETYRRLGLGKVVGRASAGAVIGTYNYPLIDGTIFRLPRIKIATPEGEDLEGTGRSVDIEVALPLGEWAPLRDSQLDAAVAALLGQIDGG